MNLQDFFLPSLVRQFHDWPEPTLAADVADLPGLVGLGLDPDPASALGERVSAVLDVLEPSLMLLALCGYCPTELLVAGAGTSVAVSLPFSDAMSVTKTEQGGWPQPVVDQLDQAPAVVALAVSNRLPLAVPVGRVRDGWFVVALAEAKAALDLSDVLTQLTPAELAVRDEVLDDIGALAGDAGLEQLTADPGLASGLLTMFDPTGWLITALDDPAQDAYAAGDADAVAMVDLGVAMAAQIEQRGLLPFLREEVGTEAVAKVPLRDRLHDERADRHLLRRGMRGARRRHHALVPDGLARAFRAGRARRQAYTEFLIGCQVEEVADLLHRLNLPDRTPRLEFTGPVYGDTAGRYLVARLPPPQQSLQTVELALANPPPAPGVLSIAYRRWGQQHDLAGTVEARLLTFDNGSLPVSLQFIDGAGPTPTVDVFVNALPGGGVPGDDDSQQVLRVSGVQHGDVFVFTEPVSGATAQLVVVKNFSRNDLDRLHSAGHEVSAAAPVDGIARLPGALVDTVTFLLAEGAATAQERQRAALERSLANSYPDARGDPTHAFPATLDIPSARGIGILPDDASHLHACLPEVDESLKALVETYLNDCGTAAAAIAVPEDGPVAADPDLRAQVAAHREATRDGLVDILTRFAGATGATSVWHSYEIGDAKRPQYLLNNGLALWPGDPIRNIRTNLGGQPTLFKSSDLTNAGVGLDEQHVTVVLEVGLFVNRRAEVELYVNPPDADLRLSYGEVLQVTDALASLVDGGLPPVGVLRGPGAPDKPGGDEPGPGGGEPGPGGDEPGPGDDGDSAETTGSVLLRVINDAATVLPLALVTIQGNETTPPARTGADGSVTLADQTPGWYSATCRGYPGHGSQTVEYVVTAGQQIDVLLTLAQDPPDPALPPLRATISEASGYYVRSSPGKSRPILGKLHYQELDVTVLEAVEVPDKGPPAADLWYRVLFNAQDFDKLVAVYEDTLVQLGHTDPDGAAQQSARHVTALAAHQGTEAWVGQAAIALLATPWPYFLDQLAEFEETYEGDDLLTRLSRLRQIGEEPDVPGNDAVGAGWDVTNQVNRAQRSPEPGRWSLLFESKQVEFADGEVVDIHHFLLGVESLIDDGRRSTDRTVFALGLYPLEIGESYAALTWSGDVGGAVGDLVRHRSPDWEAAAARTPAAIREFYFRTRAPDTDLLGDVDAWGAYDLVPFPGDPSPGLAPVENLADLVTRAYGPAGGSGGGQALARGINRAKGIRALLVHYGFTSATGLSSQPAAVAAVQTQTLIFAKTWYQIKAPSATEQPIPAHGQDLQELTTVSADLNTLFLTWLESLARQYGVAL